MDILNNLFLYLIIIWLILISYIGFYLLTHKYIVNHDNYLIHKHILDNTCDNYKKHIFLPELERLRNSYNLDPNSQVNAIRAYNDAEMKLLKTSSANIYKLLTGPNLLFLKKYYSEQVLILIIINNLRA